MKNTLLLVLCVFSLTGCGRFIYPDEYQKVEKGCEGRGGVIYIYLQPANITGYCEDGITEVSFNR